LKKYNENAIFRNYINDRQTEEDIIDDQKAAEESLTEF